MARRAGRRNRPCACGTTNPTYGAELPATNAAAALSIGGPAVEPYPCPAGEGWHVPAPGPRPSTRAGRRHCAVCGAHGAGGVLCERCALGAGIARRTA